MIPVKLIPTAKPSSNPELNSPNGVVSLPQKKYMINTIHFRVSSSIFQFSLYSYLFLTFKLLFVHLLKQL